MRSRLAIVLVLVVLGLALGNNFDLLYRLFYVLAGTLVLSYLWARANISWLEVSTERKTERAQVGQVAEERIRVRNAGRLPKLWLEVRDNSDLPGHKAAVVVNLPPGKFRSWRIRTECRRRGRYTIGPLTVESGDPFGLFHFKRTIGGTHSILVYPKAVDLPNFMLPPANLPGEGRFRRRTHYTTPNASSVREYAYGDGMNRIHWPSTARTGKLMVKEFDQDPMSDVWLVMDMEKKVQAGAEEESTEEYAVTIAASIARRYIEANRAVGLVTSGAHIEVLQSEKGATQLTRIMEALAMVKADGKTPLKEVLLREINRFTRHTTVVVITPSVSEEWVMGLRHLMRRGVMGVAVLLEPSTFGGKENALLAFGSLVATGIPTYLVKQGEPVERALRSAAVGYSFAQRAAPPYGKGGSPQ